MYYPGRPLLRYLSYFRSRLVPFERVRVAGAPSNVIRFSGLREPLKFDGPWLKLKFRLALLPRAPGTRPARPMGFSDV